MATVTRHLPRGSELRTLLVARPLRLGARSRADRCHSIEDLRGAAVRRVPRAVFDYVDGGADHELTMARSRSGWERIQLRPRVLAGVEKVDTAATILGEQLSSPLVLAPTGFTRMMHTGGELAVLRAASAAGVGYTLSTMGTTTIEDLVAGVPGARPWFQLYPWKDRGVSDDLVLRAERAGCRVLVLTVDTPVAGRRLRDLRNGLTIPPSLSPGTFLQGLRHPGWTFDLLTTDVPTFASLAGRPARLQDLVDSAFHPGLGWDDLARLRERWPGRLVVKGILDPRDARRAVDTCAVDGIVVSDHGGRQLDRSVTALDALPAVVAAVGDRCEVLLDGGVRHGADVAAAVALGARAVLVGRAYLYGLMAAGEPGVARAIEILQEETRRTLRLLGVGGLSELDAGFVGRAG
ncbi:MAG: alpha-hydroxy acid oxidase [Acidimicrobiales bacterium]